MRKINITFFITNELLNILLFGSFFKKSCNFQKKWQKTVSRAQVSFEGKEAFGDENEYNLFLWKMRFLIFFHLKIFLKKSINIFGENEENNFGET